MNKQEQYIILLIKNVIQLLLNATKLEHFLSLFISVWSRTECNSTRMSVWL